MSVSGILLGAGSASRFGSSKLLHALANGTPVGVAALRNLAQAAERVVAVIKPDDHELASLLGSEGASIALCSQAHLGMSASLACGIKAALDSDAWLIALADMPWIKPSTMTALVQAMQNGALLSAPCYRGQRGHPVGFAKCFRDDLLALRGDSGPRSVLQRNEDQLRLLECDDPGILRDIDSLACLRAASMQPP